MTKCQGTSFPIQNGHLQCVNVSVRIEFHRIFVGSEVSAERTLGILFWESGSAGGCRLTQIVVDLQKTKTCLNLESSTFFSASVVLHLAFPPG